MLRFLTLVVFSSVAYAASTSAGLNVVRTHSADAINQILANKLVVQRISTTRRTQNIEYRLSDDCAKAALSFVLTRTSEPKFQSLEINCNASDESAGNECQGATLLLTFSNEHKQVQVFRDETCALVEIKRTI